MTDSEPVRAPFALQPSDASILADHTGPLERLLDALTPPGAVLLIRAETEQARQWLNDARLETAVARSLMGPTQTGIWSLLEQTRAVSLRFVGGSTGALNALEVHAIRRCCFEQLAAAWREEFAAEPAFSILPIAPLSHMDNLHDNIAELNSLLEILVNRQLTPQFQPIVNLRDGRVFGYETLIRGPKGALLRRPGQMFRVADKARMVAWFDLACLEECFARAAEQRIKQFLFVNMDAEGLASMEMQERPLALRAREYGLSPANIVIEITERQMVGDFPRLLEDIAHLRQQGFHIAIDDAGAGYSSLRAVAELKPDFVKIDRDLVKHIDVCGERRALLTALVQYARQVGTLVLAEGAETREELAILIELGIPYAQGYLMGKPADTLRGTPRETREFIQERVRLRELKRSGGEVTAGMLARPGMALESQTPLSEAARKFMKEPGLTAVAVLEQGKVSGLLLREQLQHVLSLAKAAQVAEMLPAETIAQWMQTTMLRVEAKTSIRDVARQVIARQDVPLQADILVTDPAGDYLGVLSVRELIEATAILPLQQSRYVDSLTGLPNLVPLERELRERLHSHAPLGIIRADLTRLQAVNEQYGLAYGDDLLLSLADLLQRTSQQFGTRKDYLAHLGGDDFLLLTGAEEAQPLCNALLEGFKSLASSVPCLIDDRRQERMPRLFNTSLCSLSLAALTNRQRRFHTTDQVFHNLFDLLRAAKTQPGNRYILDPAQGKNRAA